MLLVNFEALDSGNIHGQQVEDFDIKMQTRQPGDDRDEQREPPPAEPFHGENSPSKISPVRRFSKCQELFSTPENFQLPPKFAPSSARGS